MSNSIASVPFLIAAPKRVQRGLRGILGIAAVCHDLDRARGDGCGLTGAQRQARDGEPGHQGTAGDQPTNAQQRSPIAAASAPTRCLRGFDAAGAPSVIPIS